ncbi:hypothetical protein BDY24DRAFT_169583 [Mrakia frigida]|uniref:uncharacterized protein n=1 Tax=Mrakia frigida TaxID=29902 RepID=UPI003FCC1675
MSNLQVNSTVTPGLLSLSRPPSTQRSKQAANKGGDKSEQQQPPRTPQPKLVPSQQPNSTTDSSSKPTTSSSSSDAIPQPTIPQVPTPGKQRRTRRPKRSNSDPLFPTPSSPKENQQDVDDESRKTTTITSNPPRTPSGKASSPPRASTSDQSLGPNTPTPASKSARARGGRRNEKTSTTLVAQPTPIPSSRAPPEADPNEHLYHSAPSESSFMLGPEPAAPSGDGKRSRGRSGKASKKKEGSGGSGREDAFVLDEEEGKVWDMPEKKGTDQLTLGFLLHFSVQLHLLSFQQPSLLPCSSKRTSDPLLQRRRPSPGRHLPTSPHRFPHLAAGSPPYHPSSLFLLQLGSSYHEKTKLPLDVRSFPRRTFVVDEDGRFVEAEELDALRPLDSYQDDRHHAQGGRRRRSSRSSLRRRNLPEFAHGRRPPQAQVRRKVLRKDEPFPPSSLPFNPVSPSSVHRSSSSVVVSSDHSSSIQLFISFLYSLVDGPTTGFKQWPRIVASLSLPSLLGLTTCPTSQLDNETLPPSSSLTRSTRSLTPSPSL